MQCNVCTCQCCKSGTIDVSRFLTEQYRTAKEVYDARRGHYDSMASTVETLMRIIETTHNFAKAAK